MKPRYVSDRFWSFFRGTSAPCIMEAFDDLVTSTQLALRHESGCFPFEYLREFPELNKQLPRRVWNLLGSRVKQRKRLDSFSGKRIVIVGAGPVGLRLALEAALAGATVTVIEERPDFERLNRMKLWDWVRKDLIDWGAKICCGDASFGPGGSFGADPSKCHIGICEAQALLLKCCLLMGIEVRMGVSFGGAEWCADRKWFVHADSACIDRLHAIIYCGGASLAGLENLASDLEVVHGDLAQEGKAIGIVANFKYNNDCRHEKFDLRQFDWAYQFKQDLFKRLKGQTGAELDNIVYFKGPETHYMVMTAKKACLLDKGCIKSSAPSAGQRLVGKSNIDMGAMRLFCQDVAGFFDLPTEFTDTSSKGLPQDVMIFDFSDTKRLARPVHFQEANGITPLPILFAGDALLEPFWPTGLGCIRGFFSAFDSISSLQMWFESGDEDRVKAHSDEAYKHLQTIVNPESKSRVLKPDVEWDLDPFTRYRYFTSAMPDS